MSATVPKKWDLCLVGAGLANALLALALRRTRPELRVLVLERGDEPCGDHTWSFHSGDVALLDFQRIKHLVVRSWPSYEVVFPGLRRRFEGGYHSVRSTTLRTALREACGDHLRCGVNVRFAGKDHVILDDGERIEAGAVIRATGVPRLLPEACGFQKFLGLDLRLTEPHGLTAPVLMDAAVPQEDGYRFFYLLPWDERRLLVEDTRYSDTPGLDRPRLRDEVMQYVARRRWTIEAVEREEAAALPIPLVHRFVDEGTEPDARPQATALGIEGRLFHPTTGYSFPYAVRAAHALADLNDWTPAAVEGVVATLRARSEQSAPFFRFLNRMLFLGCPPQRRFELFRRFYRRSRPTVERFYAGEMPWADRAALMAGWPPIPLRNAWHCLREVGFERPLASKALVGETT